MKIKLFTIAALVAVAFACSNQKQPAENTETAPEVEEVVDQIQPRVFFKYPQDGAKVGSPVFVEMGVEGMEVEPAGEVREGFGHHHILINQEFWPKGEVIPMSDTTLHYGKGQTDTSLELAPGEYIISLQFADGVHASYGKEMAASIKIIVE